MRWPFTECNAARMGSVRHGGAWPGQAWLCGAVRGVAGLGRAFKEENKHGNRIS